MNIIDSFMALVIPLKRQEVNKKKALLETNIWYKFNEGYTNAVRRTVKVHEFFWKFVDRRVEKEKMDEDYIRNCSVIYTCCQKILKYKKCWNMNETTQCYDLDDKIFSQRNCSCDVFHFVWETCQTGQKTMIQCEILCKRRSCVNLWKEIEVSKREKRYNKNFVSNSCKLNLKIIIENTYTCLHDTFSSSLQLC